MGSAGPRETDVLVVGGGFGGCYLLKILREKGFNVKLVEAGTTLGGVWCWNVSAIQSITDSTLLML